MFPTQYGNTRPTSLPACLYTAYPKYFEDVRTLAGYNAGEIQLESLKLLPGTEMRRRAEELGIRYSPLPPYEVLQTNEISVNELQNSPATVTSSGWIL